MRSLLLMLTLITLHLPHLQAQEKTDAWLEKLLHEKASPLLKHILDEPDSFRYQLIYTQIDRDKNNQPTFKNHYLHVNAEQYFYPASTVKLPVALLALEKLNYLNIPGLDKDTPMLTDTAYSGQTIAHQDSTAENGLPSVGHYIRKIFLVSDNDAYNRLYEWVGHEALNTKLWQKGYDGVHIRHRFVRLTEDENRHTNPIRFVKDDKVIYEQPGDSSTITFDDRQIMLGKAYIDADDEYIDTPMDFSRKNRLPLEALQQMLQFVLFPESVPLAKRFNLTPEDHALIVKHMGAYPRESTFPHYDTAEYPDNYGKFYLKEKDMSSHPAIRSFTKTGWSYGFLTDASYLVDFDRNIECMLTAVIYVNRNGVLNDNQYEYDSLGRPFFTEIADIIWAYEAQRKRKKVPDLAAFRFDK